MFLPQVRIQHQHQIVRPHRGPRRRLRHQDLQLLQEVRLQDSRDGGVVP